jgi:hypothetical protein
LSALYALLADLLVVLHLLFILFVVLGGFLTIRRPRLAWAHLPAVAWAVVVEWAGWLCPLTPWEARLRSLAGEAGYQGDFVAHYLLPLLYPQAMTRTTQVLLGALALAVNAAIYGGWWYLRRRR